MEITLATDVEDFLQEKVREGVDETDLSALASLDEAVAKADATQSKRYPGSEVRAPLDKWSTV